MDDPVKRATADTYNELQFAYDFFNRKLFDGTLPGALITVQRSGRSLGHYSEARYVNRSGACADEINMNPAYFASRPVEDTLSTLAHEMVHQWQRVHGTQPRRCYHDRQWAEKMKEIGLHPSTTGGPGGNEVGEKMSHYVRADGRFIAACKELLITNFGIVWFDRFPIHCGKDYNYAPAATVVIAKSVVQAAKASAQAQRPPAAPEGDTEQGKGAQDEEGAMPLLAATLDADQDAEVPLFSPTPVDAGLQVASVQTSAPRAAGASNRLKFTCPTCGQNAWAKPQAHLVCGKCAVRMRG